MNVQHLDLSIKRFVENAMLSWYFNVQIEQIGIVRPDGAVPGEVGRGDIRERLD